MAKLSEDLKGTEQRYLDNVKEDILLFNGDLKSIRNYLTNNINSDLKTLNSVLYEKDTHKKEFVITIYTASLNANIYYYNKYFSIHEIEGITKTGESFYWIEKHEYKSKKTEHGVNYFTFDVIEFTEPKLNGETNHNFIVDKMGNLILTNSSFFDLSKVNNNLKVALWVSKVIKDNPDRNKLSKEVIEKRLRQTINF